MSKTLLIELHNGELTDTIFEVVEPQHDEAPCKLVYSELGNWTKKGSDAYKLEIVGTTYTFTDCFTKKKFKLDICQLAALIQLANLHSNNLSEYKLFKEL